MQSEAAIRKRLEMLNSCLDGARERLRAGLAWLDSPYLNASGYQTYDKYTDDLFAMIQALEGGIYELTLLLEGEENDEDEENDEEKNDEALEERIRSLMAIPASFIDEDKRNEWIERAERNARVRAYRSPSGHVWNVWDGYRRIELRGSKSDMLDSRIEAILHLYRNGGMTLQAFEARILDAIQAAHIARPTKDEAERPV